jgi:hypothetical protein
VGEDEEENNMKCPHCLVSFHEGWSDTASVEILTVSGESSQPVARPVSE